ncbi:hypothetical protein C5167_007286 [Papaver somniferum]|nr:hypothetical protein C5167_007286 [Papaver somniferum]
MLIYNMVSLPMKLLNSLRQKRKKNTDIPQKEQDAIMYVLVDLCSTGARHGEAPNTLPP